MAAMPKRTGSGTIPYDEVEMFKHGMLDRNCHHFPWGNWLANNEFDLKVDTDPISQTSTVSVRIKTEDRPTAERLAADISNELETFRRCCPSHGSRETIGSMSGSHETIPTTTGSSEMVTSAGTTNTAATGTTGTTTATGTTVNAKGPASKTASSGGTSVTTETTKPQSILTTNSRKYALVRVKWNDDHGKETTTSVSLSCGQSPAPAAPTIDDLTPSDLADKNKVPDIV